MATICFPTVRGRVARFTRVDGCGRPLPGSCSTIVTEDIVSIKASAEVEEGEEISVKNMAGKLCISDKACDSIKWFTVEITLCKVNPALMSLVSGYEIVLDAEQNQIGYDVSGTIDCDGGFALEVWGDVPGVKCLDTGDASGGQYGYILFPWVSAATLSGDLEIQNDALQPVLSGTSKTGHGWGSGPYPVQIGPDGQPGPMIQPIPSDKHFRHAVFTVDPPEPGCECIDLAPGPEFTLAESNPPADDRQSVTATITTAGDGKQTYIDWGDGTREDVAAVPATMTHAYTAAGDYTVTAGYTDGGGAVTSHTVTVPFTSALDPAPTFTAAETVPADESRRGVTVDVTASAGSKPVTVDWGDGTDPSPVDAVPGSADHVYTADGDYTITVSYTDGGGKTATQQVTVPFASVEAPTFTVAESDPAGPDHRTVTAEVSAAAADHTVTIDWGDGSAKENVPAVPGSLDHEYAADGTNTITAGYVESPETATQDVKVPFAQPPTFTVAEDTTDTTHMTAALQVDSASEDWQLTVDWGDGSGAENVAMPPGTATHQYAAAGTYTVKVGYVGSDVNATEDVTVPFESAAVTAPTFTAAESNPPADNHRAVTAKITAAAAGHQVTVDFGDGGTVMNLANVPGGLTHAYAMDGTHTITVGYADSPETATQQVTVPFAQPGPQLTVAETDPAAADRCSVTANVTSAADGHTVQVDWGDGSALEPVTSVPGSLTHEYTVGSATASTYTVRAVYNDLPDTTGHTVTVPYGGAEPTLTAAIIETDPPDVNHRMAEAQIITGDKEVTIDWGDGTDPDVVSAPVRRKDHAYAADGTWQVLVHYTDNSEQVNLQVRTPFPQPAAARAARRRRK